MKKTGAVTPISLTTGDLKTVESKRFQLIVRIEGEVSQMRDLGHLSEEHAVKVCEMQEELFASFGKPYEIHLEEIRSVFHSIGNRPLGSLH